MGNTLDQGQRQSWEGWALTLDPASILAVGGGRFNDGFGDNRNEGWCRRTQFRVALRFHKESIIAEDGVPWTLWVDMPEDSNTRFRIIPGQARYGRNAGSSPHLFRKITNEWRGRSGHGGSVNGRCKRTNCRVVCSHRALAGVIEWSLGNEVKKAVVLDGTLVHVWTMPKRAAHEARDERNTLGEKPGLISAHGVMSTGLPLDPKSNLRGNTSCP